MGYRRLNFDKLNFSDKVVTTAEALRDVIPINWSEDIIMCSAKNCPEANKCYRHTKGDADDIDQSRADLSYNCNSSIESSFDNFMPI